MKQTDCKWSPPPINAAPGLGLSRHHPRSRRTRGSARCTFWFSRVLREHVRLFIYICSEHMTRSRCSTWSPTPSTLRCARLRSPYMAPGTSLPSRLLHYSEHATRFQNVLCAFRTIFFENSHFRASFLLLYEGQHEQIHGATLSVLMRKVTCLYHANYVTWFRHRFSGSLRGLSKE